MHNVCLFDSFRLFHRAREAAQDPVDAATAYENTKSAIDEAEKAAREALDAANEADDKVIHAFTYLLTLLQMHVCDVLSSMLSGIIDINLSFE